MKSIYRIFLYASVLLTSVAVSSCTAEKVLFEGEEGINITFRTSSAAEAQVKGTAAPGEDAYNENLLNSVYFFFYPKGATDRTPSISGFKTGFSTTGIYSVKIPVSATTIVNELFATDSECQLFAVANPPASLVSTLEGKPTLAALRAMTVVSSLKNVPQANFTLVYDGPIAATSLSQKIAVNATVEMKHLASKFTIGAIVIPSLTQGTDTYTPDALSVKLCNGINKTTLSGWDKDIVEDDDYFNSDYGVMTANGTETINEGTESNPDEKTYNKYVLTTPIYSYPMEWEFNSATEPYLMYELIWKITDKDSNTSYKPLYYKLTLGRRSIMQNEWYDISGKLTVLGSLYPEEPTEIYYYMDYLVEGWKNALDEGGINTPAEIKDTRYLAVPQTEIVLNNKESVSIPFSSSHECEVVNKSITSTSYSSGVAISKNPHFTTADYDLTVPNEITVTHKIYNELDSGLDCAPIIIEFDLRHKTDVNFTEHIKITQNPAITIETFANSGGRSSTNGYGYTYVNNTQSGNWQIVLGANESGNNSSIYLTVITVSQFGDNDFVVGDPRNPNIDNLDKNALSDGVQWNAPNPVSAPAKYKGDGQTGNRTIKYYHPTIDDGSRDNFVAPSIRVNSANCRSGQNETYENAVQRCAAYQEDGYPAGRWRLPTLAECKLIQTMSSNSLVPAIFIQNGTSYYCYAGGWFRGNAASDSDYKPYTSSTQKQTSTGGSGGGAARCVYDEWYWSQVDARMGWTNDEKTTFKWGDVPDDFVIPNTSTTE